jgi:hypothetical protein
VSGPESMGATTTGFRPRDAYNDKEKGPHIFESTTSEFYTSLEANKHKAKAADHEREPSITKSDGAPGPVEPQDVWAKPPEPAKQYNHGTLDYH